MATAAAAAGSVTATRNATIIGAVATFSLSAGAGTVTSTSNATVVGVAAVVGFSATPGAVNTTSTVNVLGASAVFTVIAWPGIAAAGHGEIDVTVFQPYGDWAGGPPARGKTASAAGTVWAASIDSAPTITAGSPQRGGWHAGQPTTRSTE